MADEIKNNQEENVNKENVSEEENKSSKTGLIIGAIIVLGLFGTGFFIEMANNKAGSQGYTSNQESKTTKPVSVFAAKQNKHAPVVKNKGTAFADTVNQQKKITAVSNKEIKHIEKKNEIIQRELDEINKQIVNLNKKIKQNSNTLSSLKSNLKSLDKTVTNMYIKMKQNEHALEKLSNDTLNTIQGILKNNFNYSAKNRSDIQKLKEKYQTLLSTNKQLIKTNMIAMNKINMLLKKINEVSENKISSTSKNPTAPVTKFKVPFDFIGTTNENGNVYAYISSKTNTIYKVTKGDIINNRYKVVDIASDKMIIEDIINHKLFILKMKAR